MTDAAHLLVDFLSFIISLLSLWLSSRPATHRLNYGWHRAGKLKTTPSIYFQYLLQNDCFLFFRWNFFFFLYSTTPLQCCNPAVVLFFCVLMSRDPGRSALRLHDLACDRSASLLGRGASRQRRLHHWGYRHAYHLWVCSIGQYYVSIISFLIFFSQVLLNIQQFQMIKQKLAWNVFSAGQTAGKEIPLYAKGLSEKCHRKAFWWYTNLYVTRKPEVMYEIFLRSNQRKKYANLSWQQTKARKQTQMSFSWLLLDEIAQ